MSRARPQDPEAALRRARDQLLRDGAVVSRADGATRRLAPLAISPAEGEALRGWVVREGAARTIEIGLGYGISALFVCEGLLANGSPDARHVVVDPYQARLGNCGLQVLEEAGLASLVEHHAEESQLAPADARRGPALRPRLRRRQPPLRRRLPRTRCTSGRSCAPPGPRTSGRSTSTSSSEASPRPTRGCRCRW